MKKNIYLFFALCMTLTMTSCSENITLEVSESPISSESPTPMPTPAVAKTPEADETPEAFSGKIAIVTSTFSSNEEEYRSAELMIEKYGKDKIIHKTWSDKYVDDIDIISGIISLLGNDTEVKAIILSPAIPGCNEVINELYETRDDIFVVYCKAMENPAEAVERANLILMSDEIVMGPAMARQAKKMGAEVFIHFSIPRLMSQYTISKRYELLKEECEKIGLKLVDEPMPDPQSDIGLAGATQFALEEPPKLLEKYGKNTALFLTSCHWQYPIIKSLVDNGGIYVQPCCPSPYHGFPGALGLRATTNSPVEGVIEETRAVLATKNELGRVSNWPVSGVFLSANVGTEYAIKWINGEVSKEGIDAEVVKELMEDYAGVSVDLRPYEDEDGTIYENFLMFIMDYMIY